MLGESGEKSLHINQTRSSYIFLPGIFRVIGRLTRFDAETLKRDVGAAPVTLTYWMNRLQSLRSPEPLLVSLNVDGRVHPEHELARFE